MNYKIFATVDEFLIFRVSTSWSPFLFNKLGYLSPFDLSGHFYKFSKVTKSNLITTDSRGHKISHQAFLPRDTWRCQQWRMDIISKIEEMIKCQTLLKQTGFFMLWLHLIIIVINIIIVFRLYLSNR